MAKKKKLNSMRILEQHNVDYQVYEFDDNIHSAEGVAEAVGVLPETVFKTLVVTPDDGRSEKPMLVIVGAGRKLDLKKFAAAAGHKKVRMARHDEAEKLTGLKVGGISALALTAKNWPVYLDETATQHERILISAGQRGINLGIPVDELKQLLDLTVVDCSQPE
jgi:Cys-tRNA(Pro)/Cys-tRNA(Cys) deacylase